MATAEDAGIGLAAHEGSNRLARLSQTTAGGDHPTLAVTGVELLDAATLQQVGLVSAGDAPSTVAIANVGGGRVVTVEGAGAALVIDAVCRDPAQPAPVARLRLLDPAEGFFGCGIAPVVRPVAEGSLFVLVPLCRSHPEQGTLRLYRVEAQGSVTHVDLPVFPLEPPVAISSDGARLFLADHQRQELSAIETATGRVLWRTRYGTVPPGAGKLKLVGAPNQIELSPDGERLYLTSNWEPRPSPGVWVFAARTGELREHLLPDVDVTGIAAAPDGNLFVASPSGGGRLWILPGGDPRRQRLVRDDLGEQVSGVVVAD